MANNQKCLGPECEKDAMSKNKTLKPDAWKFWEETLKSPRYIIAPMVDQSELAWRMMSRELGSHLCYSPMIHAREFSKSEAFRKSQFEIHKNDRPLIVQFCANDPDTLLDAAKLAEPFCDAIDINLGCPQGVARKGHYGAFLMNEWDLIYEMVKKLSTNLKIPVTCKVRVFADVNRSIDYAKMIQNAGASLLTVHGRTREQKGPLTGLASWDHILAIRRAVNIPVFSNGNIQSLENVTECLEYTGAQGVMIAEGSLYNPSIFEGRNPLCVDMALLYLQYAKLYNPPLSFARAHLFKMCHHSLQIHTNCREDLCRASSLQDCFAFVERLKEDCVNSCQSCEDWLDPPFLNDQKLLSLPHWRCQPYVRPHNRGNRPENRQSSKQDLGLTILPKLPDGIEWSKNKIKKFLRHPNCIESFDKRRNGKDACKCLKHTISKKCVNNLCKSCCRELPSLAREDCSEHKVCSATKRKATSPSLCSDSKKASVEIGG